MYENCTSFEAGKVIGHENLGEVLEVGPAVDRIKVGDRVCVPFNVSCGFCKNRERGLTGACLTVNPGTAGGAYGFADMGLCTPEGKPSTCACPTAIPTACCSRPTPRRRRPTT